MHAWFLLSGDITYDMTLARPVLSCVVFPRAPPATAPPSQVKGKTSKVDVFAPSLATDIAAALTTLPSPPRASRAASLSPAAAPGGTVGAAGSAASSPVPHGVILGGFGGGGITIPPPPPFALMPLPPFAQPEGLSAIAAPAGDGGTAKRSIGGDEDDVSSLLDDSKRYRLESPSKGTWQGGARRGSGASTDGSSGGEGRLCRLQMFGRGVELMVSSRVQGVVLMIPCGSSL